MSDIYIYIYIHVYIYIYIYIYIVGAYIKLEICDVVGVVARPRVRAQELVIRSDNGITLSGGSLKSLRQ